MAMTINTPMLLVFVSERACRQADEAMQAIRAKLDAGSQRAVYEWRMDAEEKNYSELVREIAKCPAVTMHTSAEVYYIIDGDADIKRLAQLHERLKNALEPVFSMRYAAIWQIDGYGACGQKKQKDALYALKLDHIVLLSNPDEMGSILPWDYCEIAVLAALALHRSGRVGERWLCAGYNRMGKPEKALDQRLRHTAMTYLCEESAQAVDGAKLYSECIEPAICGVSDRSGTPADRFGRFIEKSIFSVFPTAEDATAIPRDTRDETRLRAYADAFIRENADEDAAKQRVDFEIERHKESVYAAIRSEIHIEAMMKLFSEEGFFMKEVLVPLRGKVRASRPSYDDRRGLERLASYQNRILYAQACVALENVKAQIVTYVIDRYETLCQDFEREARACMERRDHAKAAVCLSPDELQMNERQTSCYNAALAAPAARQAALKSGFSGILWPEDQEKCDNYWRKEAARAADAIRTSNECFNKSFWKLIADDGAQVNNYAAKAHNAVHPMIFRYVPNKAALGYPWCWYPDCLKGVLVQNTMQLSDVAGDNLEILQLYALHKAQDDRDIAELLDDIPAFRVIEDEPQRKQDGMCSAERRAQLVLAPKTEKNGTAKQEIDFAARVALDNTRTMLFWEWQGDESAVAHIRCKTNYDRSWSTRECRYADYHSVNGCQITDLIRPGCNHVEIILSSNGQTLQSSIDIVGKKRDIYYRVETELLGSRLKNEDETQRLKVYRLRIWFKDDGSSVLERLRLARGGFTYPLNDGRYDGRTDSYTFRNICAEGGETLRIVARPGDRDEMNVAEK